MKSNYNYITFLVLVLATSCSTEAHYLNNVRYAESTRDSLTILSSGNGETEPDARINAIERAMNIILFNGVPSSQWNTPFVKDKAPHEQFFTRFFRQGKFMDFVLQNSTLSSTKKKGFLVDVQAEINMSSLRRYLEANGIIRAFGL